VTRDTPGASSARQLRLAAFVTATVGLAAPINVTAWLPVGSRYAVTCWVALGVLLMWPRRWWPPRPPRCLLYPVAALLLLAVALWPVAFDRAETARELLALVANILLALVTSRLVSDDRRGAPAWLGCLVALIAAAQLTALAHHLELGLHTRPKSYYPTAWSGYPELGLLVSVAVGILLAAFQHVRPALILPVLGLLALLLMQTVFLFSRLSYVAVGVAMAVAAAYAARVGAVGRMVAAAALAVSMTAAVMAANPTFEHLARGVLGSESAPGGMISGVQVDVATRATRMGIWTRTLQMIRDHPLGIGVGLGNFREVYEPRYNLELNIDGRRGVHAHNAWLHKAGELGVPGGTTFALLWLGVLWLAARDAWRTRSLVSYAVLYVLAALLVQNTAENFFWLSHDSRGRLQALHWMAFGIVAGRSSRTALARAPRPVP
jgi:O-antigen ligase